MGTRAELLAVVGERYRGSGRGDRSRMLDESVVVTGYHRKHAVRLLSRGSDVDEQPQGKAGPRRRCGDAVRDALVALWEASDRACSKRLRPLIPVLLPALERHGEVALDAETSGLVLGVSAAAIDRLLAEVRLVAAGGRRRAAGFSSAVRRAVPVRTFGDWGDPAPGHLEADFVAHCGPSAAGPFVQTPVLTDVATGWTECVPLVLREAGLVVQALRAARSRFPPFPLRGVDFDNDGLFVNGVVVGWCRAEGLEVTRSRACRKNGQAWVGQKNGAVVRRMVGHGRLEGIGAAEALGRLYGAARLHGNLFQPSFKPREKRREGARVVRRYHPPVAPVARVLSHPAVGEEDRRRLRPLLASTDPIVALADIRAAQAELGRRVDARGTGRAESPGRIDLARFTAGLKTAWQDGERRPTHRRRCTRRKPLPPRPSMLDSVREQLLAWLEAEPDLSAVAALQRLLARHPGGFRPEHLRTVQRFLRSSRAVMARDVLLGEPGTARGGGRADRRTRDTPGLGSIST